jgi:hypothetical protein
MEEASEAERNKASRPYDGMATRRFVEAATCKSSSPKSTSWAGCIGNGSNQIRIENKSPLETTLRENETTLFENRPITSALDQINTNS